MLERARYGYEYVHDRGFAFKAFAQFAVSCRSRCSKPRGQAIKLRAVRQCCLQCVIKSINVGHQIEIIGGATVNTNLLSLISQLRVMAGCTSSYLRTRPSIVLP